MRATTMHAAVAALMLPSALAADPLNPTTLTVVALRPANLPGISNKDTADVGGDVFFWLKDRILHPMHCRRDPSWGQCASAPMLYDDNVYTWSEVETSTPFGAYSSCNPEPSDPTGKTWSCRSHGSGPPDTNMGRSDITRFNRSQFDGDIYSPALANMLSNATSGFWYSNLDIGDCDSATAKKCSWKLAKTVSSKNATCVNNMMTEAILARNNPCFGNCTSAQLHNHTSDCWIDCFLRTVMAMPVDAITQPFLNSFASEDPSKGGCPTVPAR